MTEEELKGLLAVASRHPGIQLFVFGSAAHGPHPANDIDVFLVYSSIESREAVVDGLDTLPMAPLLDLTMMTQVESDESRFLEWSGAVRLADIAPIR